jgi:hypothetical protein
MITTVICPHCKAKLFLPDTEEDSDVLCSSCNARFVATFATLNTSAWRIKEARSNLETSMRIYDLRLVVRGQVQALEFSLPVQKAALRLMPNDRILLLRTQEQQLVLLQSITADWSRTLIESAVARTATSIFIAVAVVLIGWLSGMNFSSKYAPYIGAGLATPLAFILVKKGKQRHFIEIDEKAIARLSNEQELLQRMQVLQEKLEDLGEKKRHQVSFKQTSNNLQRQLLSVPGSNAQQSIVTRCVALAQQHESVLGQLIEGYQQRLERLQINLTASRVVEAFPENQLIDDMAELQFLEQQQQDIEAQLDSLAFTS